MSVPPILRRVAFLVLFTAAVSGTRAAHAQLAFTINPNAVTAAPGSTVTFAGTLKNNFASTLFLNGASGQFNVPSSGMVDADSFTLFYAPLSLAAGASYTGNLFDASLSNTVSTGNTYSGTFSIQGGFTANDQQFLALQDFFITAGSASTPEPASLPFALIGATTVGLVAPARRLTRRRRRSAAFTA